MSFGSKGGVQEGTVYLYLVGLSRKREEVLLVERLGEKRKEKKK